MEIQELHNKIEKVQHELDLLQNTLNTCKAEVEHEMETRHIKLSNRVDMNERRLTFAERMIFGAAALILVSVISALLTKVLI